MLVVLAKQTLGLILAVAGWLRGRYRLDRPSQEADIQVVNPSIVSEEADCYVVVGRRRAVGAMQMFAFVDHGAIGD